MGIHKRTFQSYDKYLEFLRNSTICDDPVYIAEHERAHVEEAQRLGYNPIYGAELSGSDFPFLLLGGFTDFIGRKPSNEDLLKILLAPSEPGPHDLVYSDVLRIVLEDKIALA